MTRKRTTARKRGPSEEKDMGRQLQAAEPLELSLAMPAECQILAAGAAEGQPAKGPRRFKIAPAYSGGPLLRVVAGEDLPIYVDLDTATFAERITANMMHDRNRLVGHVDTPVNDGNQISFEGAFSVPSPDTTRILEANDNGFPWQASIEANGFRLELVRDGETKRVNGQTIRGPAKIARHARIHGVAFADHGADFTNHVSIAAKAAGTSLRSNIMPKQISDELRAFIESMAPGCTIDELSDDQLQAWQQNFDGIGGEPTGGKKKKGRRAKADPVDDDGEGDGDGRPASRLQASLAAARADRDRIEAIERTTEEYLGQYPYECDALEAFCKQAIDDESDPRDYRMQLMQWARPHGQRPRTPLDERQIEGQVIEASMCLAGGLGESKCEKDYGEQVMTAARKRWRRGLGLEECLVNAARANGYPHLRAAADIESLLRLAFQQPDPRELRAAGFTTMPLPTILGNVANKFLDRGFNSVERVWRNVCSVRPVNNFHQITAAALHGGFTFEKVGPTGELKDAKPAETTYNNKAETYGRKILVSRQAIINDDLGALTEFPMKLGLGAGKGINRDFWTEWHANASTFYTTGRGNYFTGATSNLQHSSLKQALYTFNKQTDPDGEVLGAEARILVVPPEEEEAAFRLMTGGLINTGGAATAEAVANANVFQGKLRVEMSRYLSSSAISGSSTTAFYVLADPMEMAVIEVVLLNGVEQPTVQQAQADFDKLGVAMIAYWDYGVAKKEYRAAVKSKGAA